MTSLHNIVPPTDRGNNDYAGDLAKSIANGTAGVNWTDEEKKANSTSNVLTEDYIRSQKSVEARYLKILSDQTGKMKGLSDMVPCHHLEQRRIYVEVS